MILALCPHMDDEIHCAGYLLRGDAHVMTFSNCDQPDLIVEWVASLDALGCATHSLVKNIPVRNFDAYRQDILDRMVAYAETYNPDVVLCPSSTDLHQDHRVIHQEAMRAFRNAPLLLGYECPGNQRESKVNVFVEMSKQQLQLKLCAWDCYKSQHHRQIVDWGALARVRGDQCRCGLAEGYELLSMRI